jgi:hypothetical protein
MSSIFLVSLKSFPGAPTHSMALPWVADAFVCRHSTIPLTILDYTFYIPNAP